MANAGSHSGDEWRGPHSSGQRSGNSRPSSDDAVRLARALGWFSIGLGVAEMSVPGALGAMVGIQRPWTMRALGLREIAAGAVILAQPREPAWLWSRVAGDAMDLALLGAAFGARDAHRVRLTAALGTIGAVTAVDVMASRRLSQAVLGEHAAPVEISLSVGIDRSADELYRFWRNLTHLPRFMRTVRQVRPLDDLPPEQARRWQWVGFAPMGGSLKWESEITEERPGELIAWRSRPDTLLASEGSVHFAPAPSGEGTLVHLRMRYAGGTGAATAAVARMLRQWPRQQMKAELRRFKQLMETGEIATIEGQPSGRRATVVRWFQRVMPPTRKRRMESSAATGTESAWAARAPAPSTTAEVAQS